MSGIVASKCRLNDLTATALQILKTKFAGEGIRTLERTNRPGPEPGTFDHSATPAEIFLCWFTLLKKFHKNMPIPGQFFVFRSPAEFRFPNRKSEE
jgi:hypothetical protein